MRERRRVLVFLFAWTACLAFLWAAIAATAPLPAPGDSAISVALSIRGPSWTLNYEASTQNGTVFGILREANVTLLFELDWVEYGWPYYDVLVTSINGMRSDSTTGMFWQYCVNETYATRGALRQEVHEGDVILWVYAPNGGSELCR